MNNLQNALLALQYVSIILLLLEAVYIFLKWRTRLQSYLFLNCIATLINNLGYLMEILSSGKEEYFRATVFSYAGRIWISFSLFLFSLCLCKIKIDHFISIGLAVFHGVCYLALLSTRWSGLYYTEMRYVTTGIFPHNVYKHGVFHTFYYIAIIIYSVLGLFFLFRATFREKDRYYRKRLIFVVAAILVESVFFFIQIAGVVDGYDVTILGYSISTMIMYIAILQYDLLDAMELAQDFVIDELSEGIVAVNGSDEVEYFNKPIVGMFPFIETDSEGMLKKIRKSIETNKPIEFEGRIFNVERKELIHKGISRGEVFVLADDTEHYRYMIDLEKQKNIAEAANASKSTFLSIVSHEIRTPMNAVVGMTEILLRDKDKLDEKQLTYLENIRSSGNSLVMIVNDILDQSKLESGKMEVIPVVYDIRSLVGDIRMIIENRIGQKPIKVETIIDERIPEKIIGDGLRVRQILINLMNNAVKFTEEGFVRLTISCEEEKKDKLLLRFSILDSGQGIKPEDLKKLGQAFTQVDTARNYNKEGTGLGLSISRDFIHLMGGKLEINSTYGKGSEFYFSIEQKLLTKEELESSDSSYEEMDWGKKQVTFPGLRALIVDDTELNFMIAEEILKPLDMVVDTAGSGERALQMLKEETYDVVFMDFIMPRMNGVETTEKIMLLPGKKPLVIALSGDTSQEVMDLFTQAGARDFADKPIDFENVKRLLCKWFPEKIKQIR